MQEPDAYRGQVPNIFILSAGINDDVSYRHRAGPTEPEKGLLPFRLNNGIKHPKGCLGRMDIKMRKLKTGITFAVICLVAAPLLAQAASKLTEPTGAQSPSEVTTASEIPTMSQFFEAIYAGSSSVNASAAAGDESEYKVFLSQSGEVITMTPKEYLRGATAAEMPLEYPDEALKAQIIAAHTYAVSYKIRERSSPTATLAGADISDDPAVGQSYISDAEIKKLYPDDWEEQIAHLDKLIEEVGDLIIIYEGEPIVATYHAISCGMTESAQNIWGAYSPYLVGVDSSGDEQSPDFLSKVLLSQDEVKAALEEAGCELPSDPKKWFSELLRTPAGYVSAAKIGGVSLTGMQLREMFGLRSACFEVTYKNSGFTFAVKGWGHGVGMSQYGAGALAREGKSYSEILKTYYKGISFCEL